MWRYPGGLRILSMLLLIFSWLYQNLIRKLDLIMVWLSYRYCRHLRVDSFSCIVSREFYLWLWSFDFWWYFQIWYWVQNIVSHSLLIFWDGLCLRLLGLLFILLLWFMLFWLLFLSFWSLLINTRNWSCCWNYIFQIFRIVVINLHCIFEHFWLYNCVCGNFKLSIN